MDARWSKAPFARHLVTSTNQPRLPLDSLSGGPQLYKVIQVTPPRGLLYLLLDAEHGDQSLHMVIIFFLIDLAGSYSSSWLV